MNTEYPTPAHLTQLRQLWKIAFGDEDEFVDKFYELAFDPMRCRCSTEDGKIAAALYWFENTCGDQRFAYIYGVATHPDFRGQGLCRSLMEDTKEILKEQGFHGILLYPASPSLSSMYEKMGYGRWTTVTEFECEAGAEPAALRKIGPAEFARLRRELLPEGGVIQDGPDLDLLSSQAEFCAGKGWIAALTVDGGKLHCHELLGNVLCAPGILRALGCEKGFFRTPGGEKPFAMGLSLIKNCRKPAYFGLPLD